jgi:hypothetical protein
MAPDATAHMRATSGRTQGSKRDSAPQPHLHCTHAGAQLAPGRVQCALRVVQPLCRDTFAPRAPPPSPPPPASCPHHTSTAEQDLDTPITTAGKNIDAAGAGASSVSPGWLTQLNLLWSGKGVRVWLAGRWGPLAPRA